MAQFRIFEFNKKYLQSLFELERDVFGLRDISSIEKSIELDNIKYFMLLSDDEFIGFYELSIVLDEAEIIDIAIDEKYRGLHLGNMLIAHLIDFCKNSGVGTIFLDVNKNNIKALNLYKKFGFVSYNERKNYYGDSDAILMKLSLN